MRPWWLVVCTIFGAAAGFIVQPAEAGNGPRDLIHGAWRGLWYPMGGALSGLALGIVVDLLEKIKKP